MAIKLRQPLQTAIFRPGCETELRALASPDFAKIIKEELNVEELVLCDNPDLRKCGPGNLCGVCRKEKR